MWITLILPLSEAVQADAVLLRGRKKGYSTVMIEKAELGGTCLNRGCIPTKSLLQGAELYQHIQSAHRWGLSAENPMYHMDRMQLRAEEVVTKLREDLRQTMHRNHVCIKKGVGKLKHRDRFIYQEGRMKLSWPVKFS